MNEKTIRKHISCKCECKFDGKKCNSNQKWNNHKCWCQCKNPRKYRVYEKDYIWNHATCNWWYGKYVLLSIIDNSVIACDEIIEETKTVPTKSVTNFARFAIIYHIIIDSFHYLLFLHKISSKRKTLTTLPLHLY